VLGIATPAVEESKTKNNESRRKQRQTERCESATLIFEHMTFNAELTGA
jgi:hypothetical protein